MRQMTMFLTGLFLVSLASGCCCGHNWQRGCGTSPCGPGGCGVQPYGQPLPPSGAYIAPVPTQAAYGPVTTYPATIALPQSLPTYHY